MFASLLAAFLPSIVQLIAAAPSIIQAWDSAPSNSLQAVNNVVKALPPTLVAGLGQAGSTLFPKLAPEFQAAAAALVATHTNSVSWVQSALNMLASAGEVVIAAPLVVDGVFGPKTLAAIEALQAKLGIPVTGLVADVEGTAITALLAKIDPSMAPPAPAVHA